MEMGRGRKEGPGEEGCCEEKEEVVVVPRREGRGEAEGEGPAARAGCGVSRVLDMVERLFGRSPHE